MAAAEFDQTSRNNAIDAGARENNFMVDDNVGCGMPNNLSCEVMRLSIIEVQEM